MELTPVNGYKNQSIVIRCSYRHWQVESSGHLHSIFTLYGNSLKIYPILILGVFIIKRNKSIPVRSLNSVDGLAIEIRIIDPALVSAVMQI